MADTPSPGAEPVSPEVITPTDMPEATVPAPGSPSQGATAAPAGTPAGEAGSIPAPAPASGEVDSAGVVFDPARHIHKKNPHHGRWMPRKPKRVATSTGAATGAAAAGSAPPPASFIPAEEPPAAPPAGEPEAAPAPRLEPGPDHSSDAAEVVCRAMQFGLGLAFDAPEACTPTATEHRHMVEATAAYIRAKGWQTAAGLGLFLMFAAWLLKVLQQPKPREKIRSWFIDGRAARAKDVTPKSDRPAAGAESGATGPTPLPANIPPLAPS